MKHLEPEQLKKYAGRRLNADEMMRAVVHLDECAACFDVFRNMFPALSEAAREVPAEILSADEAETFHLDYAEHLKPYIDFEADAATREIVEEHLQSCSFCAYSARELREFSDGLRLRETKKKMEAAPLSENFKVYSAPAFFSGNALRRSLPAIAVLILGLGGWLIWRQTATPNLIAENQPSKVAERISANENPSKRPPENSAIDQNLNLPTPPRRKDLENERADADESRAAESKVSEEDKLLAAVPSDFRAQIRSVIRAGEISLPVFIRDWRAAEKLRGESNGARKIILSPDRQAVRLTAPTLKWRKFAAAEYVVTIYDENFNQIAVSPNLKNANWRINSPLIRGKIYTWQVKSEQSAEFYTARFKVLDEKSVERLKKLENAGFDSPLARGIVYASEGLLNEAELEFQREIKINPHGKLVVKLKSSLEKNRK